MSVDSPYSGTELELFAEALHWKSYWAGQVAPYLRGIVLAVGAGLGASVRAMANASHGVRRWDCLEPDPVLRSRLEDGLKRQPLPVPSRVLGGTLETLPREPTYDTIVYIDVLEHIDDDRGELLQARKRIVGDGHLVVLSPAHAWLYTPFDEAIGHYRRYSRESLQNVVARREWSPVLFRYLDSVGLLASLGNRLILRSAHPTRNQILFWDRSLVPLSRYLDPLLAYRVGKSILGVWSTAAGTTRTAP